MSASDRRLAGVPCLVLGAGGFIGGHLCHALVRAGAHVHGFGRPPVFAAALPPIRFTCAELADRTALAAAVAGVEIVFHLAGERNLDAANREPVADLENSVLPSVRLFELCRTAGVRRIVFVSSGGTVYGVPTTTPIPENAPTDPISAYGVNKLTVEKYLQLYTNLGGSAGVSLRVGNPYGPFQNPHRGQGLVAALMETVRTGRQVEIWGDGTAVRDYLYVEDLAEAIMTAGLYDGPERVMNVGSGTGRSVLEVLDAVCATLGRRPAAVVYRPGRPVDVPANVLDIARIRTELGWAPRTGWMEGLRRTAAWLDR